MNEIRDELALYANDLVIEDHIILFYPYPVFFIGKPTIISLENPVIPPNTRSIDTSWWLPK